MLHNQTPNIPSFSKFAVPMTSTGRHSVSGRLKYGTSNGSILESRTKFCKKWILFKESIIFPIWVLSHAKTTLPLFYPEWSKILQKITTFFPEPFCIPMIWAKSDTTISSPERKGLLKHLLWSLKQAAKAEEYISLKIQQIFKKSNVVSSKNTLLILCFSRGLNLI